MTDARARLPRDARVVRGETNLEVLRRTNHQALDRPFSVARHAGANAAAALPGSDAPRRPRPPGVHDHLVLTFCTRGTVEVEQQGNWSMTAGDALLIPAGTRHRLVETRASEQWMLAAWPSHLVAEGAGELLAPFDRVRAGAAAVVGVPAPRRAFLVSLFQELEGEVARRGAGTSAAQRSLMTLILTEIARASIAAPEEDGAAPFSPDRALDGSVVAEALRFIERRCLEPISLRDVAEAVRRSPAHVTTLVRRATGRPVQAWIIAGRLAEARHRLRQTDERVDIIAERVGYADATHFIRLFRRAHGVTPAAWRTRAASTT